MKKLSKVTLKLNNALLNVLEQLTEQLTTDVAGFVKLSHEVQFDNFPASLLVLCQFEHEPLATDAKSQQRHIQKTLKKLLLKKGILLKTMNNLQFIVSNPA